jgi:hypothetical protein
MDFITYVGERMKEELPSLDNVTLDKPEGIGYKRGMKKAKKMR